MIQGLIFPRFKLKGLLDTCWMKKKKIQFASVAVIISVFHSSFLLDFVFHLCTKGLFGLSLSGSDCEEKIELISMFLVIDINEC